MNMNYLLIKHQQNKKASNMKKKTNIKKPVSKTKVLSNGELSKNIITPVKKIDHSSFKIGGVYFEPELYPSANTIKELNLSENEINDFLFLLASRISIHKEIENLFDYKNDLEQTYIRTVEYFIEKRKGSADMSFITASASVSIAKEEAKKNLLKLTDVKQIIIN